MVSLKCPHLRMSFLVMVLSREVDTPDNMRGLVRLYSGAFKAAKLAVCGVKAGGVDSVSGVS